jgi:predicted DNA-binding protein
MSMTKKTKHLRIRLSEEQFQKLADVLIIEQKTKSVLVRDAINDYLEGTEIRIEKRRVIEFT